jgi:GNAT superfamily N-acetyltransferase
LCSSDSKLTVPWATVESLLSQGAGSGDLRKTYMADVRRAGNSSTKAMALNVAAWIDSSVVCLGVQSFRTERLWWRKPGGSPVYLSAIVTAAGSASDVLHADLRVVETAWGTEEISLWDCWAVYDLSRMGFERQRREPWYLRHPSPLPRNFALPAGLSIEVVTTGKQLAEFEEASWEGFETVEADRAVGRFGQHAEATLDDEGMHYLIARLDDRVVAGTIAYATTDMVGIYGISTVPEFRRRGYATALVRAVVSLRPDLPISVQPDPASVKIYTRTGFVPAGHVAAWHKKK